MIAIAALLLLSPWLCVEASDSAILSLLQVQSKYETDPPAAVTADEDSTVVDPEDDMIDDDDEDDEDKVVTPAPAVDDGAEKLATTAKGKNVLYFVADDLRPEIGVLGGHAQTPNIDKLANSGMLFKQAFCQASSCTPSRNSFMSGRTPDAVRIWGNSIKKPSFRDTLPNLHTLPGYFKKNGYVTFGGGKTFQGGSPSHFDGDKSWSLDVQDYNEKVSEYKARCKYYKGPTWCVIETDEDEEKDSEHRLAEWAKDTIDLGKKILEEEGTPFFIMVGFLRPHTPMVAPKRFWSMYHSIELPENKQFPKDAPNISFYGASFVKPSMNAGGKFPGGPGNYLAVEQDALNWSLDYTTEFAMRHAYMASTSWMDHNLGKILDHLDKVNLTQDTLVVLHSDHGFLLGESGQYTKFSSFELANRVPLIMRVPWKTESVGAVSNSFVELLDVYPTLTSLMGLPKPEVDGTDISELFDHPTTTQKYAAFSQNPRCPAKMEEAWDHNLCKYVKAGVDQHKGTAFMGYTMFTADWSYTAYVRFGAHSGHWDQDIYGQELYRRSEDDACLKKGACESENVAEDPEHKETITRMWGELKKHFDK